MLLPEELAVLQRSRGRFVRRMLLVAAAGILLALVPTFAYIAAGNSLQHLMGSSAPVTATVEDVRATAATCGKHDRDEYRVEIHWEFDGKTRSDSYETCNDVPKAGDELTVWLTPDGQMKRFSPASEWFALVVIGGMLGLAVWAIGGTCVFSIYWRKRCLFNARGSRLMPGIPVHLRRGPKWIWMRHAAPQFFGTGHAIPASWLLYSDNGTFPRTLFGARIAGAWWLHPVNDYGKPGRRVGLLVRGRTRLWIQYVSG